MLVFLQEFFFRGRAKPIVMQIYFVMLIFLLFSDQISRRQSLRGGRTASGGVPPVEESQYAARALHT